MVARRFLVRFHDTDFNVDHDTDHSLEVFKVLVFSLTTIPPEEQKIFGIDEDRLVSDDSDLASISDRLRVVSIADEVEQGEKSVDQKAELVRFDEELARTLQAEEAALMRIKKEEEEALMLQQFTASHEDNSLMDAKMKARIRPYVHRVKLSGREEGWISLGPWGELRGEEYWDYKPDGPIMQITISYGHAIDSVLFKSKSYDGVIIGNSVKVGGTSGDGCWTKTFCIDSSVEQLSSISLTYDSNFPIFGAIISLCFETNIGNKYGPFGERMGVYSLSIPIQGGVITGFHGRAGAGSWLYAIGIFVAPKVNSLPCSGKRVDSLHSIQDPDSAPTQLKGKGKISEEEGWIYLGPWGGKDGVDWIYKPDGPIMEISICYGKAINSILFQSKSCDGSVIGSSEKIGAPGGDTTVTFCVDSSEEQLSSIRLTYEDCNGQVAIISICFITNLKKYGPFGLRSGASSVSIPIEGGVLVGFHGRLGNNISAIGIIVAPKNNSLHSIQDPDSALTQLKGKIGSEEGWISLGPWGELRGHKYWAYKPDGPIMQITIGYGRAIDSILFKSKSYDGVVIGSSLKVGGTGGDGRWTKTFCINSSVEQLSSISLTYEFVYFGAIISICFETNIGNTYGPFGERTGDYSLSIPIEGGSITGFHGLAGDGSWLYAIGIFVAPKVNSLPCLGKKVDSLHSIQDPADSGSTYLKGKGQISEEGWISLGPWGGKDGEDWVYKPNGPIVQISICYGEAINSILFRSRSCDGFVIGSSEKIGGIGGDTDTTETFCIDNSEEQLSFISMTYKDYNGQRVITSLFFETNQKKYGPFGTTSDDARKPSPLDIDGVTISGPSSLSIPIEGGVIVGFHGRGGTYLTAIGIFVASKVNNLPSPVKKFKSLVSVQDPDYAATQLKENAKATATAKALTICEGKENAAPKVKGAVELSKGKGKAIYVDKRKETVAHQAVSRSGVRSKLITHDNIIIHNDASSSASTNKDDNHGGPPSPSSEMIHSAASSSATTNKDDHHAGAPSPSSEMIHSAASSSATTNKDDHHAGAPSPSSEMIHSAASSSATTNKDDHHAGAPSPSSEIIHSAASSSATTNKDDHHSGAPSPPSEILHSAASSSATTNKDDHHAGAPSPSFEKIIMNLNLLDSAFQEYKTHIKKQIIEARGKLKQLQKLGGKESDFDKIRKAIEKLKVQIPLVPNKDDNDGGALSPTSKMIHSDLILMDTAFAEAEVSMHRMNEKINQARKKFKKLRSERDSGKLQKADSDKKELQKTIAKLKVHIGSLNNIRNADSNQHHKSWDNINRTEDGMTHFFHKEPEDDILKAFHDLPEPLRDSILKAFQDLPEPLRNCLFCFFKFPPMATIKRTTMIYLWIGQGYISEYLHSEGDVSDVEVHAGKIFDKLIAKDFIEPIYQNYSLVPDSCKMSLSIRSCLYEEAKRRGFTSNGTLDLVPASICGDKIGCSCLINVGEAIIDSQPKVFGNMKHIRSLYLGRWQSSATHHIELASAKILHGLNKLNSLTFLSLRGISMITKLPKFISKLNCLTILDLRACHNLEVIPNEIGVLKSLTHLDMSECYLLEYMPKSLAQLSNLQVLKGFLIGDFDNNKQSCTLCDLSRLAKLRKLNIYLSVKDFVKLENLTYLERFEGLKKLTISWAGCSVPARDEDIAKMSKAFGVATLPPRLQKLNLQCFPMMSLTNWLMPAKLKELKKLYIRGGRLCDLGEIQKPQAERLTVEILQLKYLSKLELHWRELRTLFPKLIYLHQVECPNFFYFECDQRGIWKDHKAIDTISSSSMLGSGSTST